MPETKTAAPAATFMLPAEVAVAAMTGRAEMVKLARARLADGATLTVEEVDGILALAEDAVAMRTAVADRVAAIERLTRDVGGMVRGFDTKLGQVRDEIDGIVRGLDAGR